MVRPLVIGIDPATTTGVAYGRVGETPVLQSHKWRQSKGDTAEDLYGRASVFLAEFLASRRPELVAIEAPVLILDGRTNADTLAIARGLHAVFAGMTRANNIRLCAVPCSTWRKYFLGAGNLPRERAKQQCLVLCQRLRWDAPDHNAAEAAGVWLWGCSQIDPRMVQRHEPLFVGEGSA